MRKKSNSCACQRCFCSRFELRLTTAACSRVYTWHNLRPSEEISHSFNTVICFVRRRSWKYTTKILSTQPKTISPFENCTCVLNIIDVSMFLLYWQMYWSCPSVLVLATHILRRVKKTNQNGRQVSHFTLKVAWRNCPFFSASRNFKRAPTYARTNTRIGRKRNRKREREREKESLKGTTYGARGSGKTCVEHSEDSCPARFCSFCISTVDIHTRTAIYI